MLQKTIIPRLPDGTFEPLPGIHPVLQHVYRARGLRSNRELEYGLEGLLSTERLDGAAEAARLLADRFPGPERVRLAY